MSDMFDLLVIKWVCHFQTNSFFAFVQKKYFYRNVFFLIYSNSYIDLQLQVWSKTTHLGFADNTVVP